MHYSKRFLERNFKELTAIYRTRNREESDWNDYNQLCKALELGNTELAHELITNGAKLNKKPFIFPCNTPLHLTVIADCPKTVQMLIDRGALLNRKALNDDTPLIMAAKMGRNAIVHILLSANGALNLSDDDNLSHMHIACMNNRADIVKNMIQRGADVNHNVCSKSLHWPGFTPLHFAVLNQNKETVQLLLENGANILKQDARQLTPLHLAHMVRDVKIIDLILAAHKNEWVNPTDPDGLTHFHIACTRNDTSVVQHFLNMGQNIINIEACASKKWSWLKPIDFAVYHQCFDVFELLLLNGARITCHNLSPRGTMDCVIMQENEIYFNALVQQSLKGKRKEEHLEELSEFQKACCNGESQEVEQILSIKDEVVPINTFLSNKIPYTPLHLALKRRNESEARLLLNHGADITLQDANGDTPLHLAFENGMLNIAKTMVNTSLYPDSNPINSRGLSHFHIACACYEKIPDSSRNLISGFLENSADINGQVSSTSKLWPKYTPLHFAVKFLRSQNVQTLLEHNPDTTIKNEFNYIPIELNIIDFKLDESHPEVLMSRKEKKNEPNLVRFEILHKLLSYQIDAGVDLFANKGFTLLHALCVSQEPDVLEEYLINNSSDINKTVECPESIWHGYSPLHLAIACRRGKNAVILIKYGADLWLKNCKGETPSSLLFDKTLPLLFDCFLVLYGNAITEEPQVLSLLANLKCRSGLNHFQIVCGVNNLEAVECFLRNTTDPKKRAEMVNTRNNQGDTPLHSLLSHITDVDIRVVRLLLENGANPNGRDKFLRTPLYLAVGRTNSQSIIDLLVSYGADVDARDLLNRTPLHHSFTVRGYIFRPITENAEKLLDHGANINLTDFEDKAPISYLPNEDSWLPPTRPTQISVVLKHVTKIQIIGMYVSQKVKDEYSALLASYNNSDRFDEATFTAACLEEIEILKSTRINNYTTLRDILLKSRGEMATFCDNPILGDSINSADFVNKFPLYGNLVKSQVKKGFIRKSLLQRCGPSLDKLLRISLPLSCRELISHHLSDQDLENIDDLFNEV